MKYDDASWHYGGDFPEELPPEAGATHIGMFVAWALIKELGGSLHTDEFPEELEELRDRRITPGEFFIDACDEKFVDEELNDEGNAFAQTYYESSYFTDYIDALASDLPTAYHVKDTWSNYERLEPLLDRRFMEWKEGKLIADSAPTIDLSSEKPWWKFW